MRVQLHAMPAPLRSSRPMTRIEVSVSLCDLARGSCCSLSISRDHVQLCCLPLAVLSALVRLGNAPLDAL